MPHDRSLSVARKRTLMLGVLALFSGLGERTAEARAVRRIGVLSADQLGESLKKFRSLHQDAKCVVRPTEWFDERSFKRNWLLWVDCSLERGVSFTGQELSARANSGGSFGVFASFYKRKLIDLKYTLSATSIEALLPVLKRAHGEPAHITRDTSGFLDSAAWDDHAASLVVELVPVSPTVVDGDFLRIGKGLPASAVRIRISFKTISPTP